MVRLVFRPYARVGRSICTSESLRASTGVSPGFALPRRSSPSFGSRHTRSRSAPPTTRRGTGRWCARGPSLVEGPREIPPRRTDATFAFTAPAGFVEPRDSRVRRTPWSVFQDGSGGQPSAFAADPERAGAAHPAETRYATAPNPAVVPRPRTGLANGTAPRLGAEAPRVRRAPRAGSKSVAAQAREGCARHRPRSTATDRTPLPAETGAHVRIRTASLGRWKTDPPGPFASVPPVYP